MLPYHHAPTQGGVFVQASRKAFELSEDSTPTDDECDMDEGFVEDSTTIPSMSEHEEHELTVGAGAPEGEEEDDDEVCVIMLI